MSLHDGVTRRLRLLLASLLLAPPHPPIPPSPHPPTFTPHTPHPTPPLQDIYSLFHLNRSFKFISKTSNFLIPIIGWSMFLTGHVPLKRMDKKSQLECLKTCRDLLKRKVSVLFFPEGTRSDDGVVKDGAFKKGAFSVAEKEKVKKKKRHF